MSKIIETCTHYSHLLSENGCVGEVSLGFDDIGRIALDIEISDNDVEVIIETLEQLVPQVIDRLRNDTPAKFKFKQVVV